MKLFDAAQWVRDHFGPNDEAEAIRQIESAEAERVRQERERADAPALASERHRQSQRATIVMGRATRADKTPYTVLAPESEVRGGGHRIITGATGCGKSFHVLSILMQLVRRDPKRIVVIDMKGELAKMLRETFLPGLVASLPEREALELVSRIAVIAPFDESATTPFQMLVREPRVPIEIQAHEVAASFGHTIGNDLGVLQQNVLRHALTLAINVGLTFPDVAELLRNRELLRGAVERTTLPEAKSYFNSQFAKERTGSVAGLLSRLDSLCMLPSLRRMLTAPGMVRFDRLLEETITIIDLGGAPAGLADLSRFFGQILFGKLVRAAFTRTANTRSPPVVVVADEFQQLLMPEVAREFERILAQVRSQRVYFWAMFQQAAQVEAAGPSLLRILRTNTNYQTLMRSDLDDARHFAHVLPVTGAVLRDSDSFPDPRDPPQHLSAEDERRQLLERIPSLPDRFLWYWDRRQSQNAQLLHSLTVDMRASETAARQLPRDLRLAIRNGVLALSPAVIEREGRRRRAFREQLAATGASRSRATNPLGDDVQPAGEGEPAIAIEESPSPNAADAQGLGTGPLAESSVSTEASAVPAGSRRRRRRGVDLG